MDLNNIQDIVEKDGIIFLTYGSFLSQTLISGMTEALEQETISSDLSMGISTNIFTIFIELSQNIMNYSKTKDEYSSNVKSHGLIVVGKDDKHYFIHSQNIITDVDRKRIEPKVEEIVSMSKDEIKKRYRELRRSGKNTHAKGGGIGFYEIAKRSDTINYEFKKINSEKYYFHFISTVNITKTKKEK